MLLHLLCVSLSSLIFGSHLASVFAIVHFFRPHVLKFIKKGGSHEVVVYSIYMSGFVQYHKSAKIFFM